MELYQKMQIREKEEDNQRSQSIRKYTCINEYSPSISMGSESSFEEVCSFLNLIFIHNSGMLMTK